MTARNEAPARALLHICCGPCAVMPVKLLRAEGFSVTGVFYNPNIHPEREYLRRREAAAEAARRLDLPLLSPAPSGPLNIAEYRPEQWFAAVPRAPAPARCRSCYALRLQETARLAEEHGFAAFTTSLLYSRHQAHEVVIEEGNACAATVSGPSFLYRDFRSAWQEGIRLSKAWELYRQRYCACIYSEEEAAPRKKNQKPRTLKK